MSLVFGNLVQSFVNFGTSIAELKAGDPNAQVQLSAAAFRRTAAGDAAILVYIGELICVHRVYVERFPMNYRPRLACIHLHLYVHMGAHW
jgi:hypothetical protein